MASVWSELKRRNVVKVAVAYTIVGWLLVQIADVFFPALQLPAWTVTFVAALLILGFPVALLLSWAYELTPEGVKRTKSVPLSESISRLTGRKLDFVIIGLMAIGIAFLVVDNYILDTAEPFAGADIDRASLGSPVDEVQPTASGAPGEAAPPDRRSIAALPFANESAEEENAEFFANGIHDELLTKLAKISTLRVISRTSVLEYRDSPKNMREIGRELGVATLLEGRVQRAGDMVRINVQLIDAETDEHVWAETYNRELTAENVFDIQNEMATSIALALEAAMTPEEVEQINQVPTQSTLAYDFYLSGKDYFARGDDLMFMPLAVQQYERAVEEDPGFALAWAALARAHALMHWYALDRTDARLEQALAAVESAFQLAPDLPEAHIAMGIYHYQGFRDYENALAEFDLAERGAPGSSVVFEVRAYVQRRMGEHEAAAVNLGRAIERDPRNLDLLLQQSNTYAQLHRYAEAMQNVERVLEISPDHVPAYRRTAWYPLYENGDFTVAEAIAANPPFNLGDRRYDLGWVAALYARDYQMALAYLDDWEIEALELNDVYQPKAALYGLTYSLFGQSAAATEHFEAARMQVQAALDAAPEDFRLLVALGEALVGLGETQEGIELANRAREMMPKSRDANSGSVIQLDSLMRVYVPAGDYDTAFPVLDDYLSTPSWWSLEGLLPDPRLDPVRDDPRFQALVEKYSR